jgi:Trk-type K+ transport system membrane component
MSDGTVDDAGNGSGGMDPGVRELVLTIVRSLVAMTALLVAYFVFPDSGRDNPAVGLAAVVAALTLFGFVFWRQLRRIRHAEYPLMRAAEAIFLVALVFVVLMATVASAFSASDSSTYSEPLSRLDALYYTITTLATVGFGDITPTAPETRAFTTIQIVLGVALLGAGLRSLVVMAQKVKDERTGGASEGVPETDG